MNNSTTITLNDRFSMIKTNGAIQGGRAPSRGRSRGRPIQSRQQQTNVNLQGSTRNRKFLDQLEKQHKMRLALKLKNKSILRSRGRAQGQIVRNNVKRAANIKKAVNVRNMRNANSLTHFVPLNDGPRRNFRGRSRSRSQSRNRVQPTGNIVDRLGARAPRRRMGRGQQALANGAQQQQRSRSRPRSRVRLNRNNFNNRNGNNQQQQPQMKRSNSVNARLGNVRPTQTRRRFASNTRNPNTQLNKPLGGRIAKRNPRNPRNPVGARVQRTVRKNANQLRGNARNALNGNARNTLGANVRRGKIIKRGNNNQAQARGRAINRGPGNQAGQGAGRRGRSRTKRGPNNNRGGAGNVSKEQLDKQLDDYMSKGSA